MKSIVVTSINEPTEATIKFASIPGFNLYVVGDKKSPNNYELPGSRFVPFREQIHLDFSLVPLLPENHYSRKMIGYLLAMQEGANVIIDTDDDNIPYDDYCFPELSDKNEIQALATDSHLGFINVYNFFSSQHIWPRGLPLKQIMRNDSELPLCYSALKVGVIQALADGDPDVDAIYRLSNNKACIFEAKEPVVLAEQTWSPFNSQNTMFISKFFYLLYLPTTVTFRYTDILRSYVAQIVLWKFGHHLAFSKATVFQDRNMHDYLKDFESEIPMYLTVEEVKQALSEATINEKDVGDALIDCYQVLYDLNIVQSDEMASVKAWVDDCKRILMSES